MGRKLVDVALIMRYPAEHTADSPAEQYTLDYVFPFLSDDSSELVRNLVTEVAVLEAGDLALPVTINSAEYDNSYVCSPYTACVSYAREETGKLNNRLLERSLYALLSVLGVLLKKVAINKTISVNNWMLSTNLYPDWGGEEIGEIRSYLIRRYPEHAILFRSLNEHTNADLMGAFRAKGFALVPSRQVYIFDPALSPFHDKKNTKVDLKLLGTTDYEIVPHEGITEADYARITTLYSQLYIEKYSRHNPQFTRALIAHWHSQSLMHMIGLRGSDGILDGIIGFFEQNGVITAPLVGYDTAKPKALALYRLLMALAFRRAMEKEAVLNLSAGASQFKMLRGGAPFIEYSAVYTRHLSLGKRLTWLAIGFLSTHLGVRIIKAFKL